MAQEALRNKERKQRDADIISESRRKVDKSKSILRETSDKLGK